MNKIMYNILMFFPFHSFLQIRERLSKLHPVLRNGIYTTALKSRFELLTQTK